jgi:hypothetical protein
MAEFFLLAHLSSSATEADPADGRWGEDQGQVWTFPSESAPQ